jgi:hypothetical protein
MWSLQNNKLDILPAIPMVSDCFFFSLIHWLACSCSVDLFVHSNGLNDGDRKDFAANMMEFEYVNSRNWCCTFKNTFPSDGAVRYCVRLQFKKKINNIVQQLSR